MLKIIIDKRDSQAEAKAYVDWQEQRKKRDNFRNDLPTIPGRGLEMDQCSGCGEDMWVPVSGWRYCAECLPARKKRARMGFGDY